MTEPQIPDDLATTLLGEAAIRDTPAARDAVQRAYAAGNKRTAVGPEMPEAWRDLLAGLALMATRPANDISPLHCSHDKLTVCADPAAFTAEELAWLDGLGFHADAEGAFFSFRFGSA